MHPLKVLAAVVGLCLLGLCSFRINVPQATLSSEFDPHEGLKPPFFEGWYSRLSAEDGSSLAFGIGSFPGQSTELANSVCFVLVRDSGSAAPLFTSTATFDTLAIQKLGETPGLPGLPNFIIDTPANPDVLGTCHYALNATHLHIFADLGDVALHIDSALPAGVTTNSAPWGEHGESTEGWAKHLPVKLHYDVYSLRTPVIYTLERRAPAPLLEHSQRRLQQQKQQQQQMPRFGMAAWSALSAAARLKGRPQAAGKGDGAVSSTTTTGKGFIHMEKNWGEGFPKRWIWVEGQQGGGGSGATQAESFVLAGGDLPVKLLPDVTMYVFSYHGGGVAYTLDPSNPSLTATTAIDGCGGTLNVTLFGALRIVQVSVAAAPGSFAGLICPTQRGFLEDYSAESFSAVAVVRVWSRPFIFAPLSRCTLLLERTMTDVALEFGGAHSCSKAAKAAAAAAVAAQG